MVITDEPGGVDVEKITVDVWNLVGKRRRLGRRESRAAVVPEVTLNATAHHTPLCG
jgi:hypothetical protein